MLADVERRIVLELLKTDNIGYRELAQKIRVSTEILSLALRLLPGITLEGDKVVIADKLLLALEGVKKGIPPRIIAQYISWKDFEKLSARILAYHNYVVITNLLMTKPRRLEIDVLGIDPGSGRAIVIDCKHWHYGLSFSALIDVGRKHIDRTIKFLKYASWLYRKYPVLEKIRYAIPLIVTLTTPRVRKIDNRLIVININELNNFLQDVHLVVDELGVKPIRVDEVRGKTLF